MKRGASSWEQPRCDSGQAACKWRLRCGAAQRSSGQSSGPRSAAQPSNIRQARLRRLTGVQVQRVAGDAGEVGPLHNWKAGAGKRTGGSVRVAQVDLAVNWFKHCWQCSVRGAGRAQLGRTQPGVGGGGPRAAWQSGSAMHADPMSPAAQQMLPAADSASAAAPSGPARTQPAQLSPRRLTLAQGHHQGLGVRKAEVLAIKGAACGSGR